MISRQSKFEKPWVAEVLFPRAAGCFGVCRTSSAEGRSHEQLDRNRKPRMKSLAPRVWLKVCTMKNLQLEVEVDGPRTIRILNDFLINFNNPNMEKTCPG